MFHTCVVVSHAPQVKAANESCAIVLYASAYGNTTALAQAISRGITKAGVTVDMLNLETESKFAKCTW